jgi:hypothetical protein
VKSGTPRYIVVKDGKTLANEWGTNNAGTAWARALSAIQKAVDSA